jgi:hypothetical protein
VSLMVAPGTMAPSVVCTAPVAENIGSEDCVCATDSCAEDGGGG